MTLLSAVSHFSILRGIHSPDILCKTAKSLGYTGIALTDRNNLYGLPEFLNCCRKYDLKPVIGAHITASDGDALVYAPEMAAFSSLCQIITDSHCNKSFTIAASCKKYAEGIIAVTDNLPLIAKLKNDCTVFYRMKRPVVPPQSIKSDRIPCCIIPDAVFIDDEDFELHKAIRAIDLNTTVSRLAGSELFDRTARLQKWEQIQSRFEMFHYAIKTTEEFCRTVQCEYTLGKTIMPEFTSGQNGAAELLREKTYQGASSRYSLPLQKKVVDRIEYELDLIIKKGFAGYFLVVDDIVRQSPRTCGRGSGASSIVAYSLGITNVDPIRYNLMFERFLNPGRKDPPDIDVDFAWDERDVVLEYVFKKYGSSHAAMVATHQTCGARMALREAARLFGMTEAEISGVTKKIPYFIDLPENPVLLQEYFSRWPSTKGMILDQPWPQIFTLASKLIGKPRGIGTHCGGVVITPRPISNYAPVQISAKGFPIVQWEKDGTEEMGLVKIDLLGNRSLAVIRDAIRNVQSEYGDLDEQRWDPQSDQKTIDLLAKGKTIGVFYVESPAMRLLQRKTAHGDFEHMVIHSSIIRPAANKYIREYVRRLKGEPFVPVHPALLDTLSETFGIMVYQEDVSKAAIALASFSVEDADMLRKIMSKREKHQRFNDFHRMFIDGCKKNGISDTVIDAVWEMMLSFSGYSFCKPHSASYVQVSFQSAYLKAHYPAAFIAAVLSNYGGFYSTQAYISEAMRLGLTVMPPDINNSEIRYYSKGATVITGFCQIKGLSSKAQQRIIGERNGGGAYQSIVDFVNRTEIDESDVEKLISAGAFDTIDSDGNRAQQFWKMRQYYRSLSDDSSPQLTSLSKRQYLIYQYQTLGFLTVCHPLTLKVDRKKVSILAVNIRKYIGKKIAIAGWCITSKTVSTSGGESMEFVTFEDETATFEAVFFPETYKNFAAHLSWQAPFMIYGKVTEEFDVEVIEVERVERIS
ncbi:MAG TPA: DNA polymerase III subunit alpha [Chitinispirillaceae bacterium]|nr:DNA polymerase III subunit alpha [Chitinispirillaceae bacterium]